MTKKLLALIFGGFLLFAIAASSADEPKKVEAAEKPAVKKETSTPIPLTVEALQEFEQRKKMLEAKEKELDERARGLDVQEKILNEKLKRMEELNKKMADRLDKFKDEHDVKVTKLVTVVESMKPASAAEYIEKLDADLAVEILSRIEVKRAAKILNLTDKKKTARLTELYTGYRSSIDDDKKPPEMEQKKPI